MSQKVIKTSEVKPIEQPKKESKIVYAKSVVNQQIEQNSIIKSIHSSSDWHTFEPNVSGIISIPINDKREYVPFISIECKDALGGLNYYIVSDDDKSNLMINVENIISEDRHIRINYVIYF